MTCEPPVFQPQLSHIVWKKIYTREYGVSYSEMALLCLSDKSSAHVPVPSNYQVVVSEGNETTFFIDEKSWNRLVDSLNRAYTLNLKQLHIYEQQFIQYGRRYLSLAKKISSLALTQLTNQELGKWYRTYQGRLFDYSVFAWTSFILNNFVAERATSILDLYLKGDRHIQSRQHYLEALFNPAQKASILELQTKLSRYNGQIPSNALDRLFTNYRWLSCLDIHNQPWTKDEFTEHIKTLSITKTKRTMSLDKLLSLLDVPLQDAEYLKLANRFVFIKDARDDYRRHGIYNALPFFKEIARRMDIAREDISYLQEQDIASFLAGDRSFNIADTIRARRQHFVMYLDSEINPVCVHGKEASLLNQRLTLVGEKPESNEIRGTIASKGIAFGRVAIVRGIQDLDKVKKGDILVAISTHPDYVPAMRKAVAIVTDEGGITSHAAIVAREFGTPCLVGTKHATTALKDGDRVQVNADEGWIKKVDQP